MRCWDPRIEEMPVAELKELQYKLLKSLVYRLYSFSPFYHNRMKEQNVHPDDIRELSDIRKVPFMFKRDLRDSTLTRYSPRRRKIWSVTMSRQGRPENRLSWDIPRMI